MEVTGKSEHIIQNVVGCGPFQVLFTACVFILTKLAPTFSTLFMSFGIYNPGWRCLDHNNTIITTSLDVNDTAISNSLNQTTSINESMSGNRNNHTDQVEYIKENCPLFDSCSNIEFNPESSTLVTEWGLLCDKAWIASLFISSQMAGFIIGSVCFGFLGDAFGRKKVIYMSQISTTVLNILGALSPSWQVFVFVRFFTGISVSLNVTLYFVYGSEFMTTKWRGIMVIMPWFPSTAVLCGVTFLALKNWRQIHIATTVISAIGFLPFFWVPESLRWLEVKNKKTEFENTVMKMAKFNDKKIESRELLDQIKHEETLKISNDLGRKENMFKNIPRLFGKKYRQSIILVSVSCFSVAMIYSALGFGIKALGGNFYLNFIFFHGVGLVFDCVLMFAPNLLGRKRTLFTFVTFSSLCLISAACFQKFSSDNSKIIVVAAFVMAANLTINGFINLMVLLLIELYPTVMRGLATSFGYILIRLGGVVAPILIPEEESNFFICYIAMSGFGMLCAFIALFLPETKGKALEDMFQTEMDVPSPK